MADPQALKSLLVELRRVRSPLTRMKLVARAWRTVRELSPQQRQELASELGTRGVDGLLERLGRKADGIPPAEVLRALNQVDDDPVKLGALVRGLREPARRRELLRSGVGLLDGWLEDEAQAQEQEQEQAAGETTAEPVVDAVEVEEARRGTPEVAVVREILVRPATDPPAEAEAPAKPVVSTPTTAPAIAAPPPEIRPIVPPSVETGPRGKLADVSPLTRRFRALRELLDDGGRLGAPFPEQTVDAFPDGWPRRRAICLLFRAGVPPTTDEAVSLVRRLSRPVDRRWCVLALIATRKLSAAEASDLEQEFPFWAVKRRLRAS